QARGSVRRTGPGRRVRSHSRAASPRPGRQSRQARKAGGGRRTRAQGRKRSRGVFRMATVTRILENPLASASEGRSPLSQRERREPHASASGAVFAALLSSLSTSVTAADPATHKGGDVKAELSADPIEKIDGAATEMAAPLSAELDVPKFDSATARVDSSESHRDIAGNPGADLYDLAVPQPSPAPTAAPDFPSHAEQASPGLSHPADHARDVGGALPGTLALADADARHESAPHPSAGNVNGYSQPERPGALSTPSNQAAYVPVQQIRPPVRTYDSRAILSAGEPALHPSRRRESEASATPSGPSSAEGAASESSRVETSQARSAAWV